MAAPVRIEAVAFTDPRFDLLGMLLKTNRYDALGRMTALWSWCTENSRHEVPLWVACVYFDGNSDNAEAIVAAELGEWCSCTCQHKPADLQQDCQHIRLKGTSGRTEWYGELKAGKVAGGKARAASAKRGPGGTFASSEPADHQQTSSRQPASSSAPSPSPSPSPLRSPQGLGSPEDLDTLERERTLSAVADVIPIRKGRNGKAKSIALTKLEEASYQEILGRLSKANGVEYRGSEAHKRLIAGRLRDGYSELDLRKVIAYCAAPKDSGGKGWKDDAKMAEFLRPETLFGPETIQRYVDAARTWANKQWPELATEKGSGE